MKKTLHALYVLIALIAAVFAVMVFGLMPQDTVIFTDDVITEPTALVSDPAIGNPHAPITIISYNNFTCLACKQTAQAIIDVQERYPQDITVIWKDFPNMSNAESLQASLAARCAEKQGAFWSFHDYLFDNQTVLSASVYTEIAEKLELKEKRFARCMRKTSTEDLVQAGYDEAIALGVLAAPTFFINEEMYSGRLSADDIETNILSQLSHTP